MEHIIAFMIGLVVCGPHMALGLTAKGTPEGRTVEVTVDRSLTLDCTTPPNNFIEIKSARFAEGYKYDKSADQCVPAGLCDGADLIKPADPSPMVWDCINNKTCVITFDANDRKQISACGLSTPMRIVVTFRCSATKVAYPGADSGFNALFESSTCNMSSRLRRACGRR